MIDLLLASSITALVGLGLSAMMAAVTRPATQRTCAIQGPMKMLHGQLDSSLRNTQMCCNPHVYVILWELRHHPDGVPYCSELPKIERDSVTKVRHLYVAAWPIGSTQTTSMAGDTAYTTATDFRRHAHAMNGTTS